MEADSWRKIEDLFHAAVDLNEAEADALLRCVDNESLRLQVASLLAQVRQASSFLEIPAFALITRNFEQPGAPFQTSSLAENAAPLGYPIDLLELKASFPETSRFALRRCLGAGGFGIVYEAYDRQFNTIVALKTLRRFVASSQFTFKREFRALGNLFHPNLVPLYELIVEEAQWFFTMELIRGLNFLAYVRPSITVGSELQRPDFDRLRASLRQLAEGVSALHQAGRLHCDLKPTNVLIEQTGRLVILDFGLVAFSDTDAAPTKERLLVGTPEYLSPEQITRSQLSAASDWYSVGTMLFEALTGQLPFHGSIRKIFEQKCLLDPPAPNELIESLPQDLSDLCRALLQRSPEHRPDQSEILRSLGVESNRDGIASSNDRIDPPFVGRRQQLSTLIDCFKQVQKGRMRTVVIHGRSGVGKTALARRFLSELRGHPECVVFEGRCFEKEAVPYNALDSIVDNLANYLEEMPPYCDSTTVLHALAALKILFPAIHEKVWAIGKTQKTVDVANPSETRRQGFIALHQILSEIAKNKTAVMFIDDLQWGDADSADFLAELIANPKQLRLLFLGNYRTDEVQSSRLLSRLLPLLGEARGAPSFVNMQLDELEQGAATDLATALLSQSESVSHLQPEHIAREAHGHPLFISELVRHAQSQPFEKRPSGKAASETARLPSLNTAILERSTSLPAHARRLLQVIAVAGRPINTVSAFRAAQIDDSGQTGLQILRAAHLIRTRKTEGMDEVETYHDRIQEVIEKSLDEDARVETHHDLALEYERSAQVEPHILAGHFLGARVADKALGYATQAADKAKSVLAFDAACDAYRMALRALDLLPESPARDTQELALRQTFVAMLQMNKGWGALDVIPDLDRAGELAEKTGDLRHFASWLLPRSFAAWIAADLPTALALTERALPINLRHGNTTALAYTYLQRMMTRFWLGDHLGVERDFESGQTYFGDLMFRQNLIGSVIALFAYASWNAWMLGQADLARNRLVELTNAVDINNAHDVMFAAFHAALILSYLGQPEQAEVVGVSAVALAEQHFPNEVAMTRTSLGLARTFMTPPINSIALLREGIAGMLQVGQRLGTAQHTQVLALAQFQKGAVSEALDTVNYALSDHFHEPVFQPEAFRIRAAIRSRIGDTKLAEDDLEQANEIARKRSAKALELRATMTLTQLLRRMGRSQEGYQRLATVVDSFSEGFDTKDLINANALLAAMRS